MNKLEKIPFYTKGLPHKPIYSIDFLDDLEANWGEKWGVWSPFGKLRKVMVCEPGVEQKDSLIAQDYQLFNLPEGPTDFDKLVQEHRSLVAAFEAEGIEVNYLKPAEQTAIGTYGIPLRSAPYAGETIMVKGGAVIDRPATAYKKGLEVIHAKRIMQLGCPILHTIHGKGVFEGGNLIWVDDTSAVLSQGLRANEEGRAQMERILRDQGVEDIHIVHLPGYLYNRKYQVAGSSGMFHVDMTFGMAYYKVAVLWPGGVSYDTIRWLESKDVDIIEVSDEELHLCAPNILVIAPKKVMVSAIGLEMTKELRKRGIEVIELDLTEFAKGGGGPSCLTCPLVRY